jgi:hypothetical protein
MLDKSGETTPRTQKQTSAIRRVMGPAGNWRAAVRRGRQSDRNAMPDDDRVVADEDVLDDQPHDSLALIDVKRVGGSAQATEERCERFGKAQKRGTIDSLVSDRLQFSAQGLLALPQQRHALA